MSLKDTSTNKEIRPVRCKLGRLWDQIDQDDKETLLAWRSAGLGYRTIQRGLKEDGHSLGASTVEKHLSGICCCNPASSDDKLWRDQRGAEDR